MGIHEGARNLLSNRYYLRQEIRIDWHNQPFTQTSLAKWLGGCGFESRCSDLNLRFRVCFEQGVP